MEHSPKPGANVKDSVISGDVHTGNVIHNHYHVTQQPPQSNYNVQPSVPHQSQYNQVSSSPQVQFYGQQHSVHQFHGGNNKNVLLAYVLWFFLGLLGGHRFYLNQVGMGIFYVLTFGGFGLFWLLDLFLLPDLVNRANRRYIRN